MNDIDAFVFNIHNKYTPNRNDRAIYTYSDGFCFGSGILAVTGDTLNTDNGGWCYTGKGRGYDIEGDVSPLTNQEDDFTCA